MADLLRTVNYCLHRIMLFIADVALIGMVAIVTLAVTLRYVFNTGLGWAEEVPRLLVTLFAFLAMAMGVRDHTHIGVNVVYDLFPKDGWVRRSMLNFADIVVLLCGLFMLYYGGRRCIQMYSLPGRLPMTGLNTWWQYLPIPMAGLMISFDSILFLTGVLKRGDLMFSEPEVDYVEQFKAQRVAGGEGGQ
ncbi:MAG: TRAP transporter small permease [Planctomycetota bacterium]|nr:TRAP transporter small permease [Planctomycetota bacterium]